MHCYMISECLSQIKKNMLNNFMREAMPVHYSHDNLILMQEGTNVNKTGRRTATELKKSDCQQTSLEHLTIYETPPEQRII
jgi:hypothetical protein